MESGRLGETWTEICEKSSLFSFFSTFGKGVDGLLTFICICAQQAASVSRLFLLFFFTSNSLLRVKSLLLSSRCAFPGAFFLYFLGNDLGMDFAAFFVLVFVH